MATTPAKGTLLQVSISSSFTTIAARVEMSLVKSKRNKIEYTDLDSAEELSYAGIKRGQALGVKVWLDPAATTHIYLATSYNNGTTEAWKTILQDAGNKVNTFSGWIEDYDLGMVKVDGLVELSFTIQITGAHAV